MASGSLWLSFTVYSFCFVLFLTAFLAPWWKDQGGDSEGLWLVCVKETYAYWTCSANLTSDERMIATQVLESIAMGCYLIIMFLYVKCLRDETKDIRVACIGGFVAVIFQVAGLIVYGAVKYFWASGLLSWCFILAASSCALLFGNSLITYFTLRPNRIYKKFDYLHINF